MSSLTEPGSVPGLHRWKQMVRRILNLGDGTSIALLVAALGAVLILQGWKSRIPIFDMLTTIDAAQEVIDHGRLPDRGVVTSFGSFAPPGLTWLMVPGVALFRDPRLFEYVGSLALYVGTVLGVFLWPVDILDDGARSSPSFSMASPSLASLSEAPCSPGIRFISSSCGSSIGSRGGWTRTTRAGSLPRSWPGP